MNTRTDLARRLELSEVKEDGALVTGRARGMTVTLEGEPPFTGCVVELGCALPIARLVMRAGDLNHPDAVETGDPEFDDAMQVTALASYAPTIQKVLEHPPVRRAILSFFKTHPDAELNGSRLHVGSAGGVTQTVLADALSLAQTIAQRFAIIGFLVSEAVPVLPPARSRKALAIRMVACSGLAGVTYLVLASFIGLDAAPQGLGLGALAFGALFGAIMPPIDKT